MKGHDLRWQADTQTWGLFNLENKRFARGFHFEEPFRDFRFTVKAGDSVLTHDFGKVPTFIIPGRKENQLIVFALSAETDPEFGEFEATIAMGDGLGYSAYTGISEADCIVDACFFFSASDTGRIRELLSRPFNKSVAALMINSPSDIFDSTSMTSLRNAVGLNQYGFYSFPVEELFSK